ncbi:MAG: C25 family cysteine peptidase [Ardenticatenaceae bacterium]|nr:C25 family cysteine peptidase [Ardenticatenaceae bacterium]
MSTRWHRWFSILFVGLLSIGAGLTNSVSAQAPPPLSQPAINAQTGTPGVRLVRSDVEGIVLELTVPAVRFERVTRDGQTYDRPVLTGYERIAQPGHPELPQHTVLFGVPPNARIELDLLADSVQELFGRYRLAPAPPLTAGPDLRPDDPLASLTGGRMSAAALLDPGSVLDDGAFSRSSDLYPLAPVQILSSGSIRDQRYVQLRLSPLQYLPATGQLRLHQRLTIQLRFVYDGPAPAIAPQPRADGPFEAVLRQTLLNYDIAQGWRREAPAAPLAVDAPPNPAASQASWKIVTGAAGLYRLTYGELQAVGVPVTSLDPRTLKVYHDGAEVPIRLLGEQDGRFDSGDLVLFYGAPHHTRYTDTNVYWLSLGSGTGRRMATRSAAPVGELPTPDTFRSTLRLEDDRLYFAGYPRTGGGDRWYWEVLNPPNYATATVTATLSAVATTETGCRLRSTLFGLSSNPSITPDHHVRLVLNGTRVDDARWDGQTERVGEVAFGCSLLTMGRNVIRLDSPQDTGASSDVALVNWFELEYPRPFVADGDRLAFRYDQAGDWEYHIDGFTGSDLEVYDVTDPEAPLLLTNPVVEAGAAFRLRFRDAVAAPTAYLVQRSTQRLAPQALIRDTPSSWRSPDHGADYIVITHADFRSAIQPLVDHRAARGLRTVVVDVQDIYDEFSAGHFDAGAIHDFLEYAYFNWQRPAPSYVLLVGDGHYDFKDARGTGEPVFIPPYLWPVDPFIGETASDNRYVTVAGDDLVPDLAIGRLPVQTAAQATALVNKILAYEREPTTQDWNRHLVFVADNSYSPSNRLDSAGDFWALSDDVALNHVPPPYVAQRIYYDPSPRYAGESYKYTTVDSTRAAIVAAINSGALVVNYIGHAAPQFWAGENLLRFQEGDALRNTHFPVMLPMTCYEGSFQIPAWQSLAEYLLLQDGRGAVASFSADGLGVATGHDYLDRGFLDGLFQERLRRLGLVAVRAKLNLYINSGGTSLDLLDTYNLLGDPALELAMPKLVYDFDANGQVDVGDIQIIAGRWHQAAEPPYDVDGDGWVSVVDITEVAAHFGQWEPGD